MKKITNYYVISASNSDELAAKVQTEIKNQWQPFGSPVYNTKSQMVYQAIVQYEETVVK